MPLLPAAADDRVAQLDEFFGHRQAKAAAGAGDEDAAICHKLVPSLFSLSLAFVLCVR